MNVQESNYSSFGMDDWDFGMSFGQQQQNSDQNLLLGLKNGLMDASKEIGVLKDKLYSLFVERLRLREDRAAVKENFDKIMIEKQYEIDTLRSEVDSLTKTLADETDHNKNANFQLTQFRALTDEKTKELEQLRIENAKIKKSALQKQQRSKYNVLMREVKNILKKRNLISDSEVLEELSDHIFGNLKPVHVPKENNNVLHVKVEILPHNLSPASSESCSVPFISEKLPGDGTTLLMSPSESGYVTTDSNEPIFSLRKNDIDEQDVSDQTSLENASIREECCNQTFESEQVKMNSIFDPEPVASGCDIEGEAIPAHERECIVTSSKPEPPPVILDKPSLETPNQNGISCDQPSEQMPSVVHQSSSKPEAIDRLESAVPSNDDEHTPQLSAENGNPASVECTSKLSEIVDRAETEDRASERCPLQVNPPSTEQPSIDEKVCAKSVEEILREMVEMLKPLREREDLRKFYEQDLSKPKECDVQEPPESQKNTSDNQSTLEMEQVFQFLDNLSNLYDRWSREHGHLEEFACQLASEPSDVRPNKSHSDYVVVLEATDSNDGDRSPDVCDEILNEWIETDTLNVIDLASTKPDPQNCAILEYTTASSPTSENVLSLENAAHKIHVDLSKLPNDSLVCWMDGETPPEREFPEEIERAISDAVDAKHSEEPEPVIDEKIKPQADDWELVVAENEVKDDAAKSQESQCTSLKACTEIGTPAVDQRRVTRYNLRQKSTPDYAVMGNMKQRKRNSTSSRMDDPPARKLPKLEPVREDPPETVRTKNPPAKKSRKFENGLEDLPFAIEEVSEPVEIVLEDPPPGFGTRNPPAEKSDELGTVPEDRIPTNEEGPKPLEIVPKDSLFAIEEATEPFEMALEDPPSADEESLAPLEIVLENSPLAVEETSEPLEFDTEDPSPADDESPKPEIDEPTPCLPKFYVESREETCSAKATVEKTQFEQVWSTIKNLPIPEPNHVDSLLIPCNCGVLKTAFKFRVKKDCKRNSGPQRNLNTRPIETNKVKRFIEVFLRSERQASHVAMANLIASLRFADPSTITSALETVLLNSRTAAICNTLSIVCMNIEAKAYAGFVDTMKTHLKEKMFTKFFKVDEGPNSLNMISSIMLHGSFYTCLCRMRNAKEDVMNLLYESLVSLKNRAHPIACSVLEQWPQVLNEIVRSEPHKKLLVDIILFCFAHHRMEYNAELYKVKTVQEKIFEHYRVKLGEKTAEEYARDVILNVTNECWMDAVVLLCKRQMFSWAYTNVMMRYLVPLLRTCKTEKVGEALLLRFAQALRQVMLSCPYNKTITGTYNFDAIITTLSDILHNDAINSRLLKETVYLAIVELSARNFPLCTKLLSSWTPPDGRMSYDTLAQLRELMNSGANYIRWVGYIEPENTRARFSNVKSRKRNHEEASAEDQQNVIPVGVTRSLQAQKKRCEGETDAKQGNQPKKKKKKKKKQRKEKNIPGLMHAPR